MAIDFTKLLQLSREREAKTHFGELTGLAAREPFKSMSPELREIFERGKAHPFMFSKRGFLKSSAAREVLANFFESKGISLVRTEADLAKQIAYKTSVTSEKAAQQAAGLWKHHPRAFVEPTAGILVIKQPSELRAKGVSATKRFYTEAGFHEAIETLLSKSPDRIASHYHPKIYELELEARTYIGPRSVKEGLAYRQAEMADVLGRIKAGTHSPSAKAIEYMSSIPYRYGKVLRGRGYTEEAITELIRPFRPLAAKFEDLRGPLPKVGMSSSEIQKNRVKLAAKKTVEKLVSSDSLKTAEMARPATISDHTSSAVRSAGSSKVLGSLHRAAPYAMAVAAGADLLASRDKTGPFWGSVAAGIATFMTRGVKGYARLGMIGGAYALTRMIAGSIAKQHQGVIPGFEEQGRASVLRKQLTDFGSGYKSAATVAKNIIKKAAQWLEIPTLVQRAVPQTLLSRVAQETVVDPLVDRWQRLLLQNRIDEKPVTSLLPAVQVQKARVTQKLSELNRKINVTLDISQSKADEAILNYAKERGFAPPESVLRRQLFESGLPSGKTGLGWPQATPSPSVLGRKALESLRRNTTEAHFERLVRSGRPPPLPKTGEWEVPIPKKRTTSPVDDLLVDRPTKTANSPAKLPVVADMDIEPGSSISSRNTFSLNPPSPRVLFSDLQINRMDVKGSLVSSIRDFPHVRSPSIPDEEAVFKLKDGVEEAADWRTKLFSKKGLAIAGGIFAAGIITPIAISAFSKTDRAIDDYGASMPGSSLYRRGHPANVEGFQNIGVTGQRREGFTDFGTGWDAARGLAKVLGITAKNEDDLLRLVVKAPQFKSALMQGEFVKSLGKGGFGSVDLMETIVEGPGGKKAFRYARKTYKGKRAAEVGIEEARGLRDLQKAVGKSEEVGLPTPYLLTKTSKDNSSAELFDLYMEHIEDATTISRWTEDHGKLKPKQHQAVKKAVQNIVNKGLSHGDLSAANILIDKEGRIALIDPMPNRLSRMSKDTTLRQGLDAIQRSQDLMAIDVLRESEGRQLSNELYTLSTAPMVALAGKIVPGGRYPERFTYAANEIFWRAGDEGRRVALSVNAVTARPPQAGLAWKHHGVVGKEFLQNINAPEDLELSYILSEVKRRSVAKRQGLQKAAIGTYKESIKFPGRRSQRMTQQATPATGVLPIRPR